MLQSAPLLTDPAAVATAVLERYGPYVCYFDAETCSEVPMWTEAGFWVGSAGDPGELAN